MDKYYGGIEAGGTKFVCRVGKGSETAIDETRFLTTTPDETIRQAIRFFDPYARRGELTAVGIASFGPVDLDPHSPTYGFITTTPKPGWNQVELCGRIQKALGVPVVFDTDVNAAAIGERYWVSERQVLDPFIYVTVGTGIGVGVFINSAPLHGLVHPEGGHMAIPHDWQRDPFPGVCSYHSDCLEGLASGPAMARRWGQPAETLPDSHPAWELEAHYLSLAIANLIYVYSPQIIVLGGGVSQHSGLHERVREKVQQRLNGYIRSQAILEKIEKYIVPPTFGTRSGVLGAIAMAMRQDES